MCANLSIGTVFQTIKTKTMLLNMCATLVDRHYEFFVWCTFTTSSVDSKKQHSTTTVHGCLQQEPPWGELCISFGMITMGRALCHYFVGTTNKGRTLCYYIRKGKVKKISISHPSLFERIIQLSPVGSSFRVVSPPPLPPTHCRVLLQ